MKERRKTKKKKGPEKAEITENELRSLKEELGEIIESFDTINFISTKLYGDRTQINNLTSIIGNLIEHSEKIFSYEIEQIEEEKIKKIADQHINDLKKKLVLLKTKITEAIQEINFDFLADEFHYDSIMRDFKELTGEEIRLRYHAMDSLDTDRENIANTLRVIRKIPCDYLNEFGNFFEEFGDAFWDDIIRLTDKKLKELEETIKEILSLKDDVQRIFFLKRREEKEGLELEPEPKSEKPIQAQELSVDAALDLLQNQEFTKAKEILEKYIDNQPDDAQANYWLAKVNIQLEVFDEAEKFFKLAQKYNPDHLNAFLDLGNMYVFLNKTKEAKKNILKAQEIGPDNPLIYTALAFLALRERNYSDVLKNLMEAWKKKGPLVLTLLDQSIDFENSIVEMALEGFLGLIKERDEFTSALLVLNFNQWEKIFEEVNERLSENQKFMIEKLKEFRSKDAELNLKRYSESMQKFRNIRLGEE